MPVQKVPIEAGLFVVMLLAAFLRFTHLKILALHTECLGSSKCKLSDHKIKNVFQSEERTDFDVKILRHDFFQQICDISDEIHE